MLTFDHWDWARLGLAVAIVVCNFFVWRGVALEESDDKYDKETGKIWLINALAWEFFFAMVLVLVDTAGSIEQKMAVAHAETVAGEARERAATAELKVKKFETPRSVVTAEAIKLLQERLSPFQGQRLLVGAAPVTFESSTFAFQLSHILKNVVGLDAGYDQAGAISVMTGIARGVVPKYTVGNARGKELAEALAKALNELDIRATPVPGLLENQAAVAAAQGGSRDDPKWSFVAVAVGDKL